MPELPLKDIYLPEAITWWPLALGWWILLALVILLLLTFVFAFRQHYRMTLKKEALEQLNNIALNFKTEGNASKCLSELSALLRRLMISRHPHAKSAGLIGSNWLKFLADSFNEPQFNQEVGQLLLKGPYQNNVNNEDVNKLITLCRQSFSKNKLEVHHP